MKVGDRVVCVTEKLHELEYPEAAGRTKKGEDYTVGGFLKAFNGGISWIKISGYWFAAIRFRKNQAKTKHKFKNETTAELAKELAEKLKELDRQPEKELV